MTTDLVQHDTSNALAIAPDQTNFTEHQRAILQHMGVENAPDADLQVFMHQCQRTGLDPFARQIHMIGRNTKNQRTQQWETKYTIQTGIDGYRVIGHRAADRTKATVSVEAPEWCTDDGRWLAAWSKTWGTPIAARVTIRRNDRPFTATANFDEYAQTKRDGGLTQMWTQRGAGQLAKCAEALAWRMAFPHDLAGIYIDEEMHQADTTEPERSQPGRGIEGLRAAVQAPAEPKAQDITDAEEVPADEPRPLTAHTRKKMFALLSDVAPDSTPEQQRTDMGLVLGREIKSRSELTEDDAQAVVDALQAEKRRREIAAETKGGE